MGRVDVVFKISRKFQITSRVVVAATKIADPKIRPRYARDKDCEIEIIT